MSSYCIDFLRRDYGAAGMFDLQKQGLLNEKQVIVSLVTLTLFVPCLANFFMIIKGRGIKAAVLMMVLIIPFTLLGRRYTEFCINSDAVLNEYVRKSAFKCLRVLF